MLSLNFSAASAEARIIPPLGPRSVLCVVVVVTSGIRLGTAAVTTRGFNEADMDVVAEAIAMLVDDVDANQAKAMELVKGLTDKYPLYE